MPIATAQRGKILTYLGLIFTPANFTKIGELCDIVEETSEQLAQQVNELVKQLDANSEEIRKASTGITELDVIKWKPDRKCDLYSHKNQLVKQLANAIGYTRITVYPWL